MVRIKELILTLLTKGLRRVCSVNHDKIIFLQRNDKIIYNHIIFIAEYRCQTISIKQLGCYQQETRGGGQLVGN